MHKAGGAPPRPRAGVVDADGVRSSQGTISMGSMTHVRTFRDHRGVDWEVYDERDWGARGLLDWDHLPQTADPGLIFVSTADIRRLWPAPANWQSLSDAELDEACGRATSAR